MRQFKREIKTNLQAVVGSVVGGTLQQADLVAALVQIDLTSVDERGQGLVVVGQDQVVDRHQAVLVLDVQRCEVLEQNVDVKLEFQQVRIVERRSAERIALIDVDLQVRNAQQPVERVARANTVLAWESVEEQIAIVGVQAGRQWHAVLEQLLRVRRIEVHGTTEIVLLAEVRVHLDQLAPDARVADLRGVVQRIAVVVVHQTDQTRILANQVGDRRVLRVLDGVVQRCAIELVSGADVRRVSDELVDQVVVSLEAGDVKWRPTQVVTAIQVQALFDVGVQYRTILVDHVQRRQQ